MRFLSSLLAVSGFLATLVVAHPDASFYEAYHRSHGLQRRAGKTCHRRVKSSSPAAATSYAAAATPSSSAGKKSEKTAAAGSASSTATSTASAGEGLMLFTDSACGASGATDETSDAGGPNGAQAWLNCGLSKSKPDAGWTPPKISLSQIKTLTLEEALAKGSIYEPCRDYGKLFEKYGEQHGVPPILLAAFAMQESTCNPDARGDNGGAYGLMQITEDKCGDAPAAGCADPEYNIKTATAYFAKVLEEHNNNLLLALGTYNGWYDGLTYSGAVAAKNTGCCNCQQNLDYMQQMLNGWVLGLDGHSLGTIKNLDSCN
ncbi:uncharacterized protein JCM10292_002054 [Rhodotorula paludigena]|uniref:uncharacterized protein n=1 Tax=Rhodotorula paludigena TaxID=86838 RepID=UPI003178EF15